MHCARTPLPFPADNRQRRAGRTARRSASVPRRRLAIGVLLFAATAGACSPDAATRPPTDAAERIVSLAPSATEVLFEAGCGSRLVGVTSYCVFPADAAALPKVGGYLTPSYEAIMALRPDVVVVLPEHEDARQDLAALDLDVVEFDHRTIDAILDSVETAGELCGQRGTAERVVAELTHLLRRVEVVVSGRTRPRVVVSVSRGEERGFGSLSAAGPGGIYDDVLFRAGGRNAVPPGPVLHPTLSAESLLRLDPDAIVELAAGAKDEKLRDDWRALASLNAVRRKRVFVFTGDFLPVPGPRLVRFVETVARALHPDARWREPIETAAPRTKGLEAWRR